MRSYFDVSRTYTYSLIFALPLLLLYEVGATLTMRGQQQQIRNGADVLLRSLLAAGGVQSTVAFSGVLAVAALALIAVEWRKRKVPVRPAVFLGMMLESVAYALTFGTVVGTATQWMTGGLSLRLAADPAGAMDKLPVSQGVVLSLGAGLFEELVFRVLLVGGLILLFRSGGLERGRSAVFAAILAALLFSGFHYIGPFAYPWSVSSFVFRFLSGLAFSGLFILRGFGITAWTHALYDVFLTVARG
jgi:membrane protease YdiL (CAAX protease family)